MILEKGENFIWENARLLERAIFNYHFYSGSGTRILQILKSYQNEDGGFGHALEPDLRTPDSQPLFVEFGLRTLYECKLRDTGMAYKACDFLSKHADFERGIPPILPSSRNYVRAAHWNNQKWEQPSIDRLTGLVGLANWQGVRHPWLLVNFVGAAWSYGQMGVESPVDCQRIIHLASLWKNLDARVCLYNLSNFDFNPPCVE